MSARRSSVAFVQSAAVTLSRLATGATVLVADGMAVLVAGGMAVLVATGARVGDTDSSHDAMTINKIKLTMIGRNLRIHNSLSIVGQLGNSPT